MSLLDALRGALAPSGLNLVGVADPARWDAASLPARQRSALFPSTRAIIVIGNAGPSMWSAFVDDLRGHPEHLRDEEHPVDAFVARALTRADAALGPYPRRWFHASATADVHVDFRVLAELAGLGARSRLGLAIHPVHGPWIGLRAACFLDAELPFDGPIASVCDGCPAPCVTACPAGALATGAWAVDTCAAFHGTSDLCDDTCHARVACPVGTPYTHDQRLYHYNRAAGREALRAALGVDGDRYEGVGPHWGTWKDRVDARGRK